MVNAKEIDLYLTQIEDKILNGAKKRIELSREWTNKFPPKPGVYIAFEDNEVVYVGETGKISGRMKDLLDSRHHTLRRNIGKLNFAKMEGYQDANTKRKFPPHIEEMVNKWLRDKIAISAIHLRVGRKELEEKIIKKFNSRPKYNKRGERKSK